MSKLTRDKENIWRAVASKPPLRSMEEVVANFQHYVATYHKQSGYELYHDDTFIDDILYGLGKSLDEKYKYRNGFCEFKKFLFEYIKSTTPELSGEQTD